MAPIPNDYASKVGDEAQSWLDHQGYLKDVRAISDYEQDTGNVYTEGDDGEAIRNVPVRMRRESNPLVALVTVIFMDLLLVVGGGLMALLYLATHR
jgi:hypothetical protein